MRKLLISAVTLFSATALNAESVPAIVYGEAKPIALKHIVSIRFADDQFTLLQTDGTLVSQPLQSLQFTTVEEESALGSLSADTDQRAALYTLGGTLLQHTTSSQLTSALGSLPAGPYVLRQGSTSHVVYSTSSTVSAATAVSTSATLATASVPGGSAATSIPATADVTATALQLTTAGISPQLALARVDSIAFSSEQSYLYLYQGGQGNAFVLSTVASIDFPQLSAVVNLQYAGDKVTGVNPYYYDGVDIRTQGAGVTVSNLAYLQEVEYQLSGASDNGYFMINSEYKWKATLAGLTLTNPNGSVILGLTGKKGTIKSQNGYTNTLCDGAQYTEMPDIAQKAAIFGEGQLVFSGKGTLNVTSLAKHGIASDDYVSFENGQVNVLSAIGDAVHANDSVLVQSGTVSLSSLSDGIDCEGPVTIRRGEKGAPVLSISTTADGAKGIKSGGNFLMTDGNVSITQTGGPDTTGDDKSNVISIKAERNITIQGGRLVINNTARGGKAFSAGGTLTISDDAKVIQ